MKILDKMIGEGFVTALPSEKVIHSIYLLTHFSHEWLCQMNSFCINIFGSNSQPTF